MDSSLNKSNYDELSLDSLSSNDERKVVIEDSKKEKGICKSLEDDKKRVLFDNNKPFVEITWYLFLWQNFYGSEYSLSM